MLVTELGPEPKAPSHPAQARQPRDLLRGFPEAQLRQLTRLDPTLHGAPSPEAAEALLFQALELFGERCVFCTSFQAEGMVLLDLAWRASQRGAPKPRVVTLDTGRLPEATFELMEAARRRYSLDIEVFSPDPLAVASLVGAHGPNLFRQSPELRRACCRVRKVEPLRRALEYADAWVVGLRRGQGGERRDLRAVALDGGPGDDAANPHVDDEAGRQGPRLKLSPLASWSWDDVWTYLRVHGVPYHRYYDQGYTSIGCAPCTRPVKPWEDLRAGRWWWEAGDGGRECGLHGDDAPVDGAPDGSPDEAAVETAPLMPGAGASGGGR